MDLTTENEHRQEVEPIQLKHSENQREIEGGRRVIEYLHRHEEIEIVNVFLCFLVCLHFTVGRYNRCVNSWISAESPFRLSSNPSVLSMCTDAPESTTNSRSSGDVEVGVCVALASTGE